MLCDSVFEGCITPIDELTGREADIKADETIVLEAVMPILPGDVATLTEALTDELGMVLEVDADFTTTIAELDKVTDPDCEIAAA